MDVTPQQAREWVRIFPRHPLFWILAAAAIVFLLTRLAQPPDEVPRPRDAAPTGPAIDATARAKQYAWLSNKERQRYQPLAERFPTPAEFQRVAVATGSFADWLRHFPCAPPDTPVKDGHGKPARPATDPAVAAVTELRPGGPRLLGAANMLIRLRGEYLWSAGKLDGVVLHFTSGAEYPWSKFAAGERPTIQGRAVSWKKTQDAAATRSVFIAYLETLFAYSSAISLELDTQPAGDAPARPGDLFIVPGRPGRVVQVLDVANGPNDALALLLGEGATPPQSFHVLKASEGSAWFTLKPGGTLALPGGAPAEWKHRRRWADSSR